MKKNSTQKMVLSALFVALGILLPFLTGQIQQFGSMLLPMHIPVLLCGFICGPFWGAAVGVITPLLRSLLFTMPPLFPIATVMAFELLTYGFLAGLFYKIFPKTKGGTYASLILAMIGGRVVWGFAAKVFYGMAGMPFNTQIFLGAALLKAWPGILLQLIMIPPIVWALKKQIK